MNDAMNARLQILDIQVDPVSQQEAIERVGGFFSADGRVYTVLASNPEKNFSVPRDPVLLDLYTHADLLLPDGIGVVLAARLLHGVRMARVPGSEFIFDICRLCAETGRGVFVYGAKESVNKAAAEKLAALIPNLDIVGRSNGYLPESQMPDLVRSINDSGAEALLVALGSPRQERWIARYAKDLRHVRVCQAVGGTLDTIAGTVRRAPPFWCGIHLEWFYRLISEPRRVRRQGVLPIFALKVLWAAITRGRSSNYDGQRSYSPSDDSASATPHLQKSDP
jgi:N-acetylglucosaminyldiphosphoundecaprenol N-acetyl-beta-D-mannosaminyltransferase